MSSKREGISRREFLGSAAGAAVLPALAMRPMVASGAEPQVAEPSDGPRLFRIESDLHDCEIEGRVPAELDGVFYRVGPDPQYAMAAGNIPFDGEGHVDMFHITGGRVHYRSRYVRNERYVAQEKAGRILFPMYRNPYLDDPSVRGLSRATHNTHIIHHNGLLLALKEDSPPAALDPWTLETKDPVYTFNGQLPRTQPFTAHPKIDSETGNLVAFGYEAGGLGSDAINVFEITPQGRKIWDATVHVPYVGLLHDYAVTQSYIVFHVIPMMFDREQMQRGGIHWSWRSGEPSWFGFLRRGGDGSDVRWVRGPECGSIHVMGCFDDGKRLIVDMDLSAGNPYVFIPMHDGSAWDPLKGASRITRLSVDLTRRVPRSYDIETMYPDFMGSMLRQDDRYHTVPYRIGFMPARQPPQPGDTDKRPYATYVRFDHSARRTQVYAAAPGVVLAEACFAPRSPTSPEGNGYLLGVATHTQQGGRADLLILDAEHLADGPVATVRLPTRIINQVHGWLAPARELPSARA